MKSRIKKLKLPKKLAKLLPKEGMDDIPSTNLQHNTRVIQHYVQHARANLETLKTNIFEIMDAGYPNIGATGFAFLPRDKPTNNDRYDLDQQDSTLIEPVTEDVRVSSFLERANAVQTDDNSKANRYPDYIRSGLDLDQYCETKRDEPAHPDLIILNDASKMIAAINNALSQLHRIEGSLARKDFDHLAGVLPALPQYIQQVTETAQQSKLMNPATHATFLPNNPLTSLKKFITNLLKSKNLRTLERFSELKSAYKRHQENTEPSPRPSTPPPSGH